MSPGTSSRRVCPAPLGVCGHSDPSPCALTRERGARQPGPQALRHGPPGSAAHPGVRPCQDRCFPQVSACMTYVCASVRVPVCVVCTHAWWVAITLETSQLSGVTILGALLPWGREGDRLASPSSLLLLLLLREARGPGEDARGPIPAHSYVPHTRARIHRRVCTGTACDRTCAPHTQVCVRTHVCNMCVHTFTPAFR